MKTLKAHVGIDTKIVVPDQFLKLLREQAQPGHADNTPFLAAMQEKFPEDDEGFLTAVLKNGLRIGIRSYLLDMFSQSGLGGTISPATVAFDEYKDPVAEALAEDESEEPVK